MICDACETVAHCSKNGCIPLSFEDKHAKYVEYHFHKTVLHNGRHRIVDYKIVFDGDDVVSIELK